MFSHNQIKSYMFIFMVSTHFTLYDTTWLTVHASTFFKKYKIAVNLVERKITLCPHIDGHSVVREERLCFPKVGALF